MPIIYDTQKSIDKLEDYGYSYNYSQRALFQAEKNGIWVNVREDIIIEYRGNGNFEFVKYEI